MLSATYDPAGVNEQLVGLTATQTLTNKTLTAPVINAPTGIVKGDVGLGNVDNTSDATKNSAIATLTNKTIDADSNTISNIDNNEIKASAAIDTTKLADGTVTNTEFQYINSVTSNVQDQIDSKASLTRNINAQTGTSYTLVLSDEGKLVTLTSATAVTLTIPTNASVAFPIGTQIDLSQDGAGAVTVG